VCSKHSRPIEGSGNEVLCHGCYISEHDIDESQARLRYLESDSNFSLWYSSYRIEFTSSREDFLFDESDYNEFDSLPKNEQVYLDDDNDFFDS